MTYKKPDRELLERRGPRKLHLAARQKFNKLFTNCGSGCRRSDLVDMVTCKDYTPQDFVTHPKR